MSDLNTTIIDIFNDWFLKQHGLLPEQAIQRIAELEARLDGAHNYAELVQDKRINELEARLKIEQSCNRCGQYHGREPCDDITDLETEIQHGIGERDNQADRIRELEDYITELEAERQARFKEVQHYKGRITELKAENKALRWAIWMSEQLRMWLRRRLVWATVDQATGKPLHWYQRFFRWIGWP